MAGQHWNSLGYCGSVLLLDEGGDVFHGELGWLRITFKAHFQIHARPLAFLVLSQREGLPPSAEHTKSSWLHVAM